MTDDPIKKEAKPSQDNAAKTPGLMQVLGSVLSAVFGIQSDANRKRDFNHGKPSHYIVVAIIVTVVIIASIIALVKLILQQAGL